jgi:hypothetical protein
MSLGIELLKQWLSDQLHPSSPEAALLRAHLDARLPRCRVLVDILRVAALALALAVNALALLGCADLASQHGARWQLLWLAVLPTLLLTEVLSGAVAALLVGFWVPVQALPSVRPVLQALFAQAQSLESCAGVVDYSSFSASDHLDLSTQVAHKVRN